MRGAKTCLRRGQGPHVALVAARRMIRAHVWTTLWPCSGAAVARMRRLSLGSPRCVLRFPSACLSLKWEPPAQSRPSQFRSPPPVAKRRSLPRSRSPLAIFMHVSPQRGCGSDSGASVPRGRRCSASWRGQCHMLDRHLSCGPCNMCRATNHWAMRVAQKCAAVARAMPEHKLTSFFDFVVR